MCVSLIQLDLNSFSSICINFNFVFHTFSGNNIYLVNELTAFSLQFSFNDLTWHLLTGDLDGVLNRYLSLHVLWVHIHRRQDRKSTRLNSSHVAMSYAVVCSQKKT